jgi:hypothetical protein
LDKNANLYEDSASWRMLAAVDLDPEVEAVCSRQCAR